MFAPLQPGALLTALLVPAAALLQEPAPSALDLDGSAYERLDAQANAFTRSSQDAVALATDDAGRSVLVWQSRRQQEGAYGVYARSFGPDGAPTSQEVQVNATTESHQKQPVVAIDDQGCTWFAWRSFGQDGSLGTIVARRFDPSLASATGEVIVNDVAAGNQTDPAIAALPGGGALVVWLDPGEGQSAQVRARRLDAEGKLDGEAFAITSIPASHRTPAVASDGAGAVTIAYARVDATGAPSGVFVRTLEGEALSDELRLDVAGGARAIEPALAVRGEQVLAGWLEGAGAGYGLRVRTIHQGVPGPVRELDVADEGWINGLGLALDGRGGALATWNRYADGPKREAGLFARHLDAASGKPAGEPFRVTASSEGKQAIAVATPGAKCALLPDGRMVFGWHGDAGQGDGSGANLTLLAPAGVQLAAAAPRMDAPSFADPSEGAANPTHDPPTFNPRNIERDRTDDQGPAAGGVFDFLGFTNTGWTPPDPAMSAGPNHIVAMVNGRIGWFLKDGTLQFSQDINGGGGFWGSVGASGFVYDPEVVYDTHSQRFFVFASDGNAGFLLGVSDDSDPNGSWHKYKINTGPLFGVGNVDSGNLAIDEDIVTITGDIFSPDRLVMLFIDKASAMAGGPLVHTNTVISGRQSMGTTVNYDAGTQPLYLTWAEEFTTATTMRIYAVTDRATTPVVQFTTMTVPQYAHPDDPPQLGTSVRPELFEARFWSSMVVGGHLWAVHHEGSPTARVQWYEFDLGGWPTSGSPSLIQSGQFNYGAGIFTFFPSIWADAAGNAAITFNQSSANEYISMQMVTREAGDPAGQMSPPELVRTGVGPDKSGRFGDYSATVSDPVVPGSFWGHHEYRGQTGWRTRIARIDVCAGSVVNYCTTSPNSAGAGALMATTGSTSIGANDLVLQATAAPAGQFGLFFFGDGQQSVTLGDGTLCVGGTLHRFPVVTVDGAGLASYGPDLGNLPGGVILSAGSTQNFQFWFRDPGFGPAGFNLSDGVAVTFCN